MAKDQRVLTHPIPAQLFLLRASCQSFPIFPQYWGVGLPSQSVKNEAVFSPAATSPSCYFQTYTVHFNIKHIYS